jgi:hypothetical protein
MEQHLGNLACCIRIFGELDDVTVPTTGASALEKTLNAHDESVLRLLRRLCGRRSERIKRENGGLSTWRFLAGCCAFGFQIW